jgi:NTE family protein
MADRHPRISLVLSGGSARGLAHLGVLEVLAEKGIPVHEIVGASYGSILAGYVAHGYSLEDIHRMVGEFRLRSVLDIGRPKLQLLSNEKVRRIFEKDLDGDRVENLTVPVAVTAIDVVRNEPFVFDEGPLATAILASSAFPGLLGPVGYGDRLLIDGGFLNRYLTRIARERGADIVIFSNVCLFSYLERRKTLRRLYGMYARRVMSRKRRDIIDGSRAHPGPLTLIRHAVKTLQGLKEDRDESDVLIAPVCGEIKPLRFGAVERARSLGRCAAEQALDSIGRAIDRWRDRSA